MTLHAKNLGWSRGGHLVLDGVTVDPAAGETIGLPDRHVPAGVRTAFRRPLTCEYL